MSILVGTFLRIQAKYRVTILSINFVKSVILSVKSHLYLHLSEGLYDMILVNK